MAYITVKHKVKDVAEWKKGFDQNLNFRKSGGEKSHSVFADSNNNIFGLFEFESDASAKKFFNSPELKEKMQEVGVVEEPDIHFVEKL